LQNYEDYLTPYQITMKSTPVEKIAANISKHQLLRKGETILVCVSGGCDSLALISILMELQNEWDIDLHLLHFDHGLRPESQQERQFIETFARKNTLPCHIHVSNQLATQSSGIQEKARSWRLAVAEETRIQIGAHHIATAHHRNDQAETFLLKFLRGCHLSNLQGMEWRNNYHIRPLLNCEKSELQSYLNSKSQIWMEDSSNQSSKYLRNRIRLELIPLLDELARGELHTRLDDLSEQSKQLKSWINQTNEGFQLDVKQNPLEFTSEGISVERLLKLPPLSQETILRKYLIDEGVASIEYTHMKSIMSQLHKGNNQWELHLPGKKVLKRNGQKIGLFSQETLSSKTIKADSLSITFTLPQDWVVQCRYLKPQEVLPSDGMILFNISQDVHLQIRYRAPGDRFHPHWKRHPIKLKDFLRDQNIPLHQRDLVPIICRDNQTIAMYPQYCSYHNKNNEGNHPALHFLIFQKKI